MPSRREDLENLIATPRQEPQSAEWEIGKPSLRKTVIYLAIIILLGLGMFWKWSDNSVEAGVRASATAKEQEARSITATVQAVEAIQEVEATSQARTTKIADAVATAVEAIIVEIRATATALAVSTSNSSPQLLTNIVTPPTPPAPSTWRQHTEKLPYDQ